MTTKVTVDAHAGWPVSVRSLNPETHRPTTGYPDVIVPPHEKRDFYVHSSLDLHVHEVQPGDKSEDPTFGQKAVGLTFNPSGDPTVNRLMALYAEVIDVLDALRAGERSERARLASVAITEAQGAQMWAVKAATWKN